MGLYKNLPQKYYLLIAFLCMIFVLVSCQTIGATEEPLKNINEMTEEEWIEDIDYLAKNLSQKHVNAFHSIKKEDFYKKLDDLKAEVGQLEPYKIKFKLAQIIASIGDAHTALSLGITQSDSIYPIGLWWFEDELRVVSVEKEYEKILGSQLIDINGISIDKIIDSINTLISHENDQWLKAMNVTYIQMPKVLKFFNITKEDNARFTFKDDSGSVISLDFIPKKIDDLELVYVKDLVKEKPLRLQYDSNDKYNSIYWHKYIPEEKILYFQYNKCIDKNVAKKYGLEDYNMYPDFNEYTQNLIKIINEEEIDKFIIDLRKNTGGDSTLMTNFVKKIKNIRKLQEEGKIFVITGRQTYSSGVFACVDLKKYTKALFYGEPTGGNVNGYGEVKVMRLPNSGINIYYSTKYFNISSDYEANFIPDVIIEESFNDYINGIDKAYEAIKAYK